MSGYVKFFVDKSEMMDDLKANILLKTVHK